MKDTANYARSRAATCSEMRLQSFSGYLPAARAKDTAIESHA